MSCLAWGVSVRGVPCMARPARPVRSKIFGVSVCGICVLALCGGLWQAHVAFDDGHASSGPAQASHVGAALMEARERTLRHRSAAATSHGAGPAFDAEEAAPRPEPRRATDVETESLDDAKDASSSREASDAEPGRWRCDVPRLYRQSPSLPWRLYDAFVSTGDGCRVATFVAQYERGCEEMTAVLEAAAQPLNASAWLETARAPEGACRVCSAQGHARVLQLHFNSRVFERSQMCQEKRIHSLRETLRRDDHPEVGPPTGV